MKNDSKKNKLEIENGAIQVQKVNRISKLSVSENVPHVFEIYKSSNPYLSIHDGNSATFKMGIRETKPTEGVFRIVQMSNGGDPDSAESGISMTMEHNVGIGTDDPQERLHVNGHLKVEGDIFLQSENNLTINLTSKINELYQEITKLNDKIVELEKRISGELK